MNVNVGLLVACGEFSGNVCAISLRAEDLDRLEILDTDQNTDNNAEEVVVQMDSMATVIDHANATMEASGVTDQNTNEQNGGFSEDELVKAMELSLEETSNNQQMDDVSDSYSMSSSELTFTSDSSRQRRYKNRKQPTHPEFGEKEIELVMSQANCSLSDAINALAHNNDVVEAIMFLEGVESDVKNTQELVQNPRAADADRSIDSSSESASDTTTTISHETTQNDNKSVAASSETSCEPIAQPLPSGSVWGQPSTYPDDDTVSSIESSSGSSSGGCRSYTPSSIPFHDVSSQKGTSQEKGSQVIVKARLGCPAGEDKRKFGIWHSQLELKEVDESGWADQHTDLSQYIGWHFTKVNGESVSNHAEFDEARLSLKAGEEVAFTMEDRRMKLEVGVAELFLACRTGESGIVKRIVESSDIDINMEYGSDRFRSMYGVSGQRLGKSIGHDSMTPLTCACKFGNLKVVRQLLSSPRADVNGQGASGNTGLHVACEKGNLELVKLLIEDFHAQVNIRNGRGETPVLVALNKRHLEIVKVLIQDFNVQVNGEDEDGNTLLHRVAEVGSMNIVEALIDNSNAAVHAQVNIRNGRGETPVLVALNKRHLEIVKVLIQDFNVQVNVEDEEGNMLLHKAVEVDSMDLVEALIDNSNAAVHVQNTYGRTPLHVSAERGHVGIVKFLISSLKKTYPSDFVEKIMAKDKYDMSAQGIAEVELVNVFESSDHAPKYKEILQVLATATQAEVPGWIAVATANTWNWDGERIKIPRTKRRGIPLFAVVFLIRYFCELLYRATVIFVPLSVLLAIIVHYLISN